jgi:hypothetical protein
VLEGVGDVVTYFVAFVNELMRASDELETVDVIELHFVSKVALMLTKATDLRGYFISEQPPSASGRDSPGIHIFWMRLHVEFLELLPQHGSDQES